MNKHVMIALMMLAGSVSCSLTAQDRGREDRGREDRGREDRGREDRGREDRGRGDRGRFDRGGDRGRGERERFDPAQFLDRLDRDQNGFLDPNEISGRSRGWIEQMGFDASKPISLGAIKSRANTERQQKEFEARKEQRNENREVPKFGEPIDWPPVADFSIEQSSSDDDEGKYDEEIMSQVNRIIERYDRNRDRVLDQEENSRLRWESLGVDLNGDKKYTVKEIAEFYKRRTQEARARDNRDRNERDRNERRPPTVTTRIQTPSMPSVRAPVVKKQTQPLDTRFNSYVDNIIKKYDKNGDGKLNKDEMKVVRVPFKDQNGDGDISREEALAYVGGRSKNNSSPAPQMTADKRGNRRRPPGARPAEPMQTSQSQPKSGSTSVRREITGWQRTGGQDYSRDATRRNVSSRFTTYDSNQDGQIQMSEFARPDEWTSAKLSEFNRLDGNRDGVITSKEWSNSSGG